MWIVFLGVNQSICVFQLKILKTFKKVKISHISFSKWQIIIGGGLCDVTVKCHKE